MRKFVEKYCPREDDINFWLDVKVMPKYKNWESLGYAKDLKAKMFEDDFITETAPHGTRKLTTMEQRREYATKAKLRKANIAKLRKLRKAKYERKACPELLYGLANIPGTETAFIYTVEAKKLWSNNQRQTRHEGKAIARDYMLLV